MADVEKLHALGREVGEAIDALKDGMDMTDIKEVVDIGITAVACSADIQENELAAGLNISAGLLDHFAATFREAQAAKDAAAAKALEGGGGLMGLLEILLGAGGALAVGMIEKHLTKLPNNTIPFVNAGLGFGAGMLASGGDIEASLAFGIAASTSATGAHQALKIGTRNLTERLARKFPKMDALQVKVGPGAQMSL